MGFDIFTPERRCSFKNTTPRGTGPKESPWQGWEYWGFILHESERPWKTGGAGTRELNFPGGKGGRTEVINDKGRGNTPQNATLKPSSFLSRVSMVRQTF